MLQVPYLVSLTHHTILALFLLFQSFHGSLRKLGADGQSSLAALSNAWEQSYKLSHKTVSCHRCMYLMTALIKSRSCYVHHRSNGPWVWNCLLHCLRVCHAGRTLLPQRTPDFDIYVQCLLVCRLSDSSRNSCEDSDNSW